MGKTKFFIQMTQRQRTRSEAKRKVFMLGPHLYLLSQEGRLKVRFDHHFHLQLGASHLTYQRDDTERQDDVFSGSVPGGKEQAITYKMEERKSVTAHTTSKYS